MSDGPEPSLPPEYIALLQDMPLDVAVRTELRHVAFAAGDDALASALFPMPTSWRTDDYRLFCTDRRVRTSELARRVSEASNESLENGALDPLTGASEEMEREIEEWTREQFFRELKAWRQANPNVHYEP